MEAVVSTIRPAAVAGLFYPDDGDSLRAEVQTLLAGASTGTDTVPTKAVIVPHAGYIYSGPIAASAYAHLLGQGGSIRRVILLGPSHHIGFHGVALPHSNGFATPLGVIPVDMAAIRLIADAPGVVFDDRPHACEHSLEVQLPFLQSILGDFSIVPLCLGQVDPSVVGNLLETLWGGPETLIVASSDLSHYHPYASAQAIDRQSMAQIQAFQANLLPQQACGCTAINALLLAASQHGLIPVIRDIRNSGDTAGDRNRVVGYAAVSFLPATNALH